MQIVTLMGDLLNVQRGQCSDAQAVRTAASQPKTVSEFFNTHLTEKLLFLCDVASAHDLPEIWIKLVAGNSKRERDTIEMRVRVGATGLGDTDLAPVITPDLSKKIIGVHLVGNNLDDFTDGVNTFLMVVQDNTSPGTKKQYFNTLLLASDYDTLVGGAAAAELSDIRSMRTAIKVQIHTTSVSMHLILQGFNILLVTLLKPGH